MSTYHIYSSLINNAHKRMRKMLPKKSRDSKLATMKAIIDNQPDFTNTLDFLIFCEEWSWMKSGYQTLFPKDRQVIDRLLSADFETRELSSLELPFESFVLAMPKGYEVNGVELPSILVTWGRFDEYGEDRINPLTDKLDLPRFTNTYPESTKGQMGIQIVHRDVTKNPNLMYARCSVTANQFHELLKSRTLEDFQERAGRYEDSSFRSILDNEPRDLVIQFNLLKLVIALAIYNQATEGVHLRPGMPEANVKLVGRIPGDRSVATTLSMPSIPRESTSPESHYRRWHFRQLHAERYYQGEYENRPRGSRWTFVRDAYVGAPADSAHTVEDDQ